MALTDKQREIKKEQQDEYLKSHQASYERKLNNNDIIVQKYNCFLEKDDTLSFVEITENADGTIEGGVLLSRKYNPTDKPYWNAVNDTLNEYGKILPAYYQEIASMLAKNGKLNNFLALNIVTNSFGKVLDDIDIKILKKKINSQNLDVHNKILSDVNKILNDALLYMNCKQLNRKTGQYEELSADERLKIVERKFAEAKQIISKQFKDNKNEQANRSI